MNRVLVTGASGFVGRHLCSFLASRGHEVVGACRSLNESSRSLDYELRAVGDMRDGVDWGPLLKSVDCVVHLAARAHVMRDTVDDPIEAFREINVKGTEQLLRHQEMKRVRRFIYISSIKVHGEETMANPFSAHDLLAPVDPYGQSKREAEELVDAIGSGYSLPTVIIRPPLIYGPGVRGNFVRLLDLVAKGVPLPLGLTKNHRSMVGVRNLCDLIGECLVNPSAPGNKFLVSDGTDVSTSDLIRLIAASMSRSARLLPVPPMLLGLVAKMSGQSALMGRLLGSLQVDIEETRKILNWAPPLSMADEIQLTVRWFQERSENARH